ncbi:hypothetical protein EMCRGX_G025568 [Ephydatia muelleri]
MMPTGTLSSLLVAISCIFAIVNGATLNGTVYIMMDGSYQFVPNIIDEQRGAAYGSYEQSSLEIGWGVLNLAAGYSQSIVATDYQLMKAAGMLEGILTWRYLNDSEYRPNATKNDKRAIRRRACSFVLRDGLLYFTEDGTDSTAKQWIVDKESQMKVITSCHDQKLVPKMLHPIPVKIEVWHQIGIDLVGPLKLTRRGNRYLATCIDYFSKWPEAQALPKKIN